MSKRRRFKQSQSLEERLAAKAEHLREKAEKAPPGTERETLMRGAASSKRACT